MKAQTEKKHGSDKEDRGKLPESPKTAEEIWQQSVIGDYLARFKVKRGGSGMAKEVSTVFLTEPKTAKLFTFLSQDSILKLFGRDIIITPPQGEALTSQNNLVFCVFLPGEIGGFYHAQLCNKMCKTVKCLCMGSTADCSPKQNTV